MATTITREQQPQPQPREQKTISSSYGWVLCLSTSLTLRNRKEVNILTKGYEYVGAVHTHTYPNTGGQTEKK